MEDLDELIDVAGRGIARQSSLSQWSLPSGAQALVEDHSNGFGCHTELEDRPWWELDLGALLPLRRIIIANHCDRRLRHRAARLMVEVSRDGEEWTMIHAGKTYFGDGIIDPAMQIELDDRILARFIRLSLPERQYLHLRRVIVLVARGLQMLAEFWQAKRLPLPSDEVTWTSRGGDYRLARVGEGESDDVVGLSVRACGRMGNNFMQISNALFLAERLGLPYVWAPLLEMEEAVSRVCDDATTLIAAESEPPPGLFLDGDYFDTSPFGGDLMSSCSMAERYRLTRRFIAPLLGFPPAPCEGDPERAKELVVHIRSGDIFMDDPHPGYVQPPLSFYTSIVEELQNRGMIDRVCIVTEDRLNPCIDALESYLLMKSIPHHLRIGENLRDDVTYLRGARHLVFGFGTFGLGICLLSGPIDTLHTFDMGGFDGLPNIRELTVITPKAYAYIAKGDWKRSPEQLRLMLELPREQLQRRKKVRAQLEI